MLSDGAARAEFLAFYEKAVNARRDTSFNLKTFNDLIYLFRFICGKYIENEIVPDDAAVLKMLTNYEKYRETLKTDDRRKIISVIGRYSENRRAIPQAVFAKLGKIYPSEPESCKSTAMTVILDLLHTNIMRDKLFAFISATYDGECAESRGIICEDLSRVFYGGFLQPDILEFYGKHFGEESENVKEIILEKLLMTIRTESIQKTILEFIDKYQAPMSPQLKRMIYHTFYEMLPENDTLSKRIIPVLGRCMASDDEPTQLEVFAHICELITADEAKGNGENALLEICLSGVRNGLPLGNMLLKKAFCGQNDEEFFETVANAFLGGSLVSIGNALKLLWDIIPEPTGAAYELFYGKVSSLIPSVTQKNDLFDLLDFDKKMRDALAANFSGIGNKFYGALYPTVLTPIIGTKLSDAFNVGRNKCGLRAVLAYAEADENLKFLPGAQAIREVIAAAELVKQEKYEKALETLMNIPLYMESGKMVSETLKAEFKHIDDGATGDIYRDAVIGAMYSYLENGKILLGGIFSRCLERKRTYDLYNNPVKPKATAKDIQDADSRAAMTVFGFIVQLCVAVCGMECSREVKEALCVNPDSEFDKLASRILSSSTKKSKDLFGEIYDYALHGSLRVARKLENAAVNTDKCPRAFKKLF